MKKLILFLFVVVSVQFAFAQNTYDKVYQILQTNCAASCHKASNPTGDLLLDGTKQDVMSELVNVTPTNTVAAAKGYKRIYPGNARKSFLFQKVNHGLDPNISLQSGEGNSMPNGLPALSQVDREMIRQWIIFGAEDTLYPYANDSVITLYYNGFAEQREPTLPVPDPNDGRQIYYGPIFLMPGQEVEFDGKFSLDNPYDAEVYNMNVAMNKESHHMAVFKYHSGNDTLVEPGLEQVMGIGDAAALFFMADVVAQWPDALDVTLPPGTALFWDSNTVLSISYHILNYSDSIVAAELYMNTFYRPRQPNTVEMTSYPVRYDGYPQYQGGDEVFNLIIPPTGTNDVYSINQWHADSTFYWNLWSIQAHTHKLGKDYNVYLRNPNGTKGQIIYDGSYDATYTFDQGFYDWEHPPLRFFDPPLSVDMTTGMIHEATYNNNTGDTVGFGLLTTDEMFVSYIFYYKTNTPVGIIPGKVFNDAHVKFYPNPAIDNATVHIGPDVVLNSASFIVYDILGNEVLKIDNIENRLFNINTESLSSGQYFYRLINNSETASSGKFLKE